MSGGGAARTSRRRWLVPEVVQTSAMDCGPAALKSLLDGFHVPVDYGQLRTACQTDVDGTSVDTLEELACQLGLEAEQVMVPHDHIIAHGSVAPALVVTVGPTGATHFVILWRSFGPLVQVMDPARGRIWMHRQEFERDLYIHDALVPAGAWRTWAGTSAFIDPLRSRLETLGLSASECASLLDHGLADPTWRSLGVLDAAARMLASLQKAKALSGREVHSSLRTLSRAEPVAAARVIPDHCWSVRSTEEDDRLHFRGAVLLRVLGRSTRPATATPEPAIAASLVAAQPERPLQAALKWMRADGLLTPAVAAGAAIVAVTGVVIEATLLRSVLDVARELRLPEQGLIAGLLLGAFSFALLAAEWVLGRAERRAGNHLESRLRVALLSQIPALPDSFLQSRPVSDLLERAHSVHLVRELPQLGFRMLRIAMEMAVTAAAIAWIASDMAWLAFGAVIAAVVIPGLGHRVLAARDLKVRTHAGALERFHLDALLGRTALEVHGARPAIENEHEHLLREWTRASLALQRGTVTVEAIQMLVGFGLAGWMLLGRLGSAETGGLLLVAYWMLNLPALGYELTLYAREYPAQRNTLLRLLDVLNAPAGPVDSAVPREERGGGVSIDFHQVQIKLGGHTVLDVDVRIPSGSHVAIVGTSGAGKSTLAGLLLGWYEPSQGELRVDDEAIDALSVQALRRETAWADPSVRVWNRSLLENLTYGGGSAEEVGPVLDAASLMPVLAKLPDGLATTLGEGGSLLSAGEAQRIRLGRAMLRRDARLVILDEPFVGLERERRRALLAEARRRWSGSTLLYVTHDVAEARGFDRVLLVEDGRIAEDGDPRVLAQTMGSRYRRLLHAQESANARFASSDWKRMRLENGRLVQDYQNAAVEHSA